jgi:hypothetical protein
VKIFLKNKNNFIAKNHREIWVRTILVWTLYLIKYSKWSAFQVLYSWVGSCNDPRTLD